MCGITGFWQPEPAQADSARELVLRMARRIAHRGPDDEGIWIDPAAGLALGHRRLSIVDLSPAGHQPMLSASGRYVIAFNGEIYNHEDLRRNLEHDSRVTLAWRGHSDTETLLAAIEAWGLKRTLQACIGMFAVVLWDRQQRRLSLARDRAGEKPLYYGWQGEGRRRVLLFGSELRALKSHPSFAAEVDADSLQMFMQHGYVPAPHSIYRGIHKLKPGTLAVLAGPEANFVHETYWSAVDVVLSGSRHPMDASPEEAVDQLESLLKDAVRRQMVADVPLGAFLSGGVDSSTVVALMQTQSARPVRTFSIGFHEDGFDEAHEAKRVAAHLGTDHTELYVTAEQALQLVPLLPGIYDEPFADSSQVPTHLVALLARRHVTVALSGDAGDELFCGYSRYQLTQRLWRKIQAVPLPLRQIAARAMLAVREPTWDSIATGLGRWSPAAKRMNRPGEKIHKGARAISGVDAEALYRLLVSHWQDPGLVVPKGKAGRADADATVATLRELDDVPRMMALDLLTYLPDAVLAKVDRAAMAASLETRVPMLDHRVIEFAWHLPMGLKLREGTTKWALRQVLYRHVPKSLVERPKMGFGVPVDRWLRGPLRDWAESLLAAPRLAESGLLAAAPIRDAWRSHLNGSANHQQKLWNVLMFQAWQQQQAAES